ncbi:MAG TPA: hypothetical protein VJW73_02950, partial [Gemmatimonadaceae bacterium]|nr:hypothetical protein [Gemmatimonadaceae bacterium]
MFVLLLVVTFTLATAASYVVTRMFDKPLAGIIARLIPDELSVAWHRYVLFGLYLIGVNGGVRIWEFQKYVLPIGAARDTLILTPDRWALEVYRTLMGTLQSTAQVLLLLFICALIGYVIVRARERTGLSAATPVTRAAARA